MTFCFISPIYIKMSLNGNKLSIELLKSVYTVSQRYAKSYHSLMKCKYSYMKSHIHCYKTYRAENYFYRQISFPVSTKEYVEP